MKAISSLIKKQAPIFIIGACGYVLIELLYRGHSHWSMALCGGICLCGICSVNKRLSAHTLWLRAGVSTAIITAVEFVCGCIVNLLFGLNVWDYSDMPLNLLGQICLPFCTIWFALSAVICKFISLYTKSENIKKLSKN